MSATAAMEVNAEARRILAVSISKLYASRTQRGGLRLHRNLLLSLVMRSARDIYHSSRESEGPGGPQPAPEEPMETGSGAGSSGSEDQPEPQPAEEPERAAVAEKGEEEEREEQQEEEEEEEEEGCEGEIAEDKENLSPARQSRKRRGKASAAPDFLPSKRARLEPGEERYAAPLASCRAGESLAALSLNRVIPAF